MRERATAVVGDGFAQVGMGGKGEAGSRPPRARDDETFIPWRAVMAPNVGAIRPCGSCREWPIHDQCDFDLDMVFWIENAARSDRRGR